MENEDLIDQLVIEEYKSCRDLISRNIEIMERNEIYAIGAYGALLVFTVQSSDMTVRVLSAWLPFVVAVLGFIRFKGLDRTIQRINDYLEKFEGAHPPLGWTRFYRENKSELLMNSRNWLWIVLVGLSLIAAVYLTCHRADG